MPQQTQRVSLTLPNGQNVTATVPQGLSDDEISARVRQQHPDLFANQKTDPQAQAAPAQGQGGIDPAAIAFDARTGGTRRPDQTAGLIDQFWQSGPGQMAERFGANVKGAYEFGKSALTDPKSFVDSFMSGGGAGEHWNAIDQQAKGQKGFGSSIVPAALKMLDSVPFVGPALINEASADAQSPHPYAAAVGGAAGITAAGKATEGVAGLPKTAAELVVNPKNVVARSMAEGRVGRQAIEQFGLSPGYAAEVAEKVDKINLERVVAQTNTFDLSAVQRRNEARLTAEEQQVRQQLEANLDAQVDALHRGANTQLSNIEGVGQGRIMAGTQRLQDLQKAKTDTGRQIVADASKAVFEEHSRVQKPFIELNEAITQPIADAADIRAIIQQAAADKRVQIGEIPSAATKALGKSEASEVRIGSGPAVDIAQLPQSIRDILTPEEMGARPKTFADVTRIKEDVYQAAQASKDGAVRAALTQAGDAISDIQQAAADKAGMGDKYRTAKQEYSRFMRNAGSGLMNDWLAAKDVEQQALAPKLAKLTSPANAEALRTILKSLGIDVSPLDQIRQDMAAMKASVAEVPKDVTAGQRSVRSALAEQIKQAKSGTAAQVSQNAADYATQKKTAARGFREWTQRTNEAAERNVTELEARGSIVPGKNATDLAGLSVEEINKQRMDALLHNMRASGISNPSGLIMTIYGLTKMASGNPRGAIMAGYGISRIVAPDMMRKIVTSDEFQEHLFRRAGIIPSAPQKSALRRALADISVGTAAQSTRNQKRPQP